MLFWKRLTQEKKILKKSSFVSVAKPCFQWRISYAGEVTPRWSCAEDVVSWLPHRARREKPPSPTPRLWTAHTRRVNYGGRRRLVTPLPPARRPKQALAPPAGFAHHRTVSYMVWLGENHPLTALSAPRRERGAHHHPSPPQMFVAEGAGGGAEARAAGQGRGRAS